MMIIIEEKRKKVINGFFVVLFSFSLGNTPCISFEGKKSYNPYTHVWLYSS